MSRIYVVGAIIIRSPETHGTNLIEQCSKEHYKAASMNCHHPTEPRLSIFYKEKPEESLIVTFKTSHFETIIPHICKEEGLNNEVWDRLPIYAQSMAKKGGVSSYLAEMSLTQMMCPYYRHRLPDIDNIVVCVEYNVLRTYDRLWHFIAFDV